MSKNNNRKHRRLTYIRDNFSCVYCGRKFTPPKDWDEKSAIHNGEMYLELDHIIPIAEGGSDAFNNKQSLCRKCNQYKSNLNPLEHIERIIIKRDRFYSNSLAHLNRLWKYRNRGSYNNEIRSTVLFRKEYKEYKYFQTMLIGIYSSLKTK